MPKPRPPAQNRPQQNYLSGNAPGHLANRSSQNNRKRKKDIVPPVEPLTEDPVARAPLDEGERQEIEAWKAERRKHWPSDANMSNKQRGLNGGADDTRQITLGAVLETQQRLGLLRKAGTEDLARQLHKKEGGQAGRKTTERRPAARNARGGLSGRVAEHRRQNTERKKTLLERLLEKDITSEEAKVVQLFHFVHMNGYLWGKEGKDLVFIPTASAKQQVGMVGVDVDVDAGEVGDDHEDDGDDDRDAGDEVENE